jgi:hypothetical protein
MPGKHNAGGCGCCDCPCAFVANFSYDDDPESSAPCMLYFEVGSIESECVSLDYEDADITVVLKKNGTVISEPLTIGSTGVFAYWERWKPVANDVYTAEITLNCGADTTTETITYTIPDPANTSCNCCTEKVPDYVTVSGITGPLSILNGTWALSQVSSCTYDAGSITGTADPPNPCTGGTELASCSNTNDYYFYDPKTGSTVIQVVMPGATGNITINLSSFYNVWRYRPAFSDCSNTGNQSCEKFKIAWVYEIECNGGVATLLSRTEGLGTDDGGAGSTLTSGVPDPTVTISLVL